MKAETSNTGSKNVEDVKKMSKHGFLEKLKQTAAEKKDHLDAEKSGTSNKSTSSGKKKTGGEGWNALKDDFMMNSKLQDWDKELSSDEGDDVSDANNDNAKKRDADDVMDDWSSDEDSSNKRRKMRT